MDYTIERSVVARCRPEAVLDRILAPSTWPQWQQEITSTSGPPKVSQNAVVHGRATLLGFDVEGVSMTVDLSERAFEEDVVVGVRMRVRYEVEPRGDHTVIVHRLTTELPSGAAGRVLGWLLRRRLARMQRTLLERLAAQSEAGPPS